MGLDASLVQQKTISLQLISAGSSPTLCCSIHARGKILRLSRVRDAYLSDEETRVFMNIYEKHKQKTFACGELNSFSSAMDSHRRLQRGKVRVCMFQLVKLLPDGVSFGTTFDSVVSDHGFQIKVPVEARGNS